MGDTDRYVTLEAFLKEEFGVSNELLIEMLNDPLCVLRNARDLIQPRQGLVSVKLLIDELSPVVIGALQIIRLRRLKKIRELQAEVKVVSEIDSILASKLSISKNVGTPPPYNEIKK